MKAKKKIIFSLLSITTLFIIIIYFDNQQEISLYTNKMLKIHKGNNLCQGFEKDS